MILFLGQEKREKKNTHLFFISNPLLVQGLFFLKNLSDNPGQKK